MPLRKATHLGECQYCGATQKLPGGVLAKHGYQVQWNEFHGVCSGASEPPYEQSCALIETYIAAAKERRASMVAFRDRLLSTPATEPKGWLHEYREGGWARGTYHWREVDLVSDERGMHFYLTEQGQRRYLDRHHYGYDHAAETLLEIATAMNRVRAKALDQDIAAVDSYIAWQQQRVAAWAPRELTPIPEEK